MKNLKKLISLLLVAMMIMAMSSVAWADSQLVGTASEGTGTISIKNPVTGESYGVKKIFDAKLSDDNGSIAYVTKDGIPSYLNGCFEFVTDKDGNAVVDADGWKYIQRKGATIENPNGTVSDSDIIDAIKGEFDGMDKDNWEADASVVSNGGTPLVFQGLKYGYYVVLTTHSEGVVSIDSTNPDATIVDKNTTIVIPYKNADKKDYTIGETITYTADFTTTNWMGTGDSAEQVIEYEISDTLPEFLDDVEIQSVVIKEGDKVNTLDPTPSFDQNKSFRITWADEVTGSDPKEYTSRYMNGSHIIVTYTAVLTQTTNIGTDDTNTVTIKATVANSTGEGEPWDEVWSSDASIKTYAAALKKTDGTNPLPGATFKIKGLTVTGNSGVYTVTSYNSAADAEDSIELSTDENGKLYILGLASDATLTVTEYKAPDGYNILNSPISVPAQILTSAVWGSSGKRMYDSKNNLVSETSNAYKTFNVEKNVNELDEEAVEVINKSGLELPSTGGIGTTIFYIIGSLLVIGSGVILVSKKRVNAK